MTTMSDIKTAILDYITQHDYVSFAQLQQRIPGFVEENENERFELIHAEFDNVVLWAGMSKAAVDAVNALQDEKKIHWEPQSNALCYWCDGAVPQLPLAKRPKSYAKPHWLPMMYRPGPTPEAFLKAYDRRVKRRQKVEA
jgi:hypothetical protein